MHSVTFFLLVLLPLLWTETPCCHTRGLERTAPPGHCKPVCSVCVAGKPLKRGKEETGGDHAPLGLQGNTSQLAPLPSHPRTLVLVPAVEADYTATILSPTGLLLSPPHTSFSLGERSGSVTRGVSEGRRTESLQGAGTFPLDFIKF